MRSPRVLRNVITNYLRFFAGGLISFLLTPIMVHTLGKSGDLAAVPPKAATIGHAEVMASKCRMDMHALTVGGTGIAWQRMISRLVRHGSVTPKLPASILQALAADVFVSESTGRGSC